jgi:hypothetical protein
MRTSRSSSDSTRYDPSERHRVHQGPGGPICVFRRCYPGGTGIDPKKALSKSDEELWPPELAVVYRKNDQAVHGAEKVEGVELIPQNGELHSGLSTNSDHRESKSGRVSRGVGVDINDRKIRRAAAGPAARLQTIRRMSALTSREVHDIGRC